MIDRIIKLFTSLKLTVVCLGLGALLVFFGTIAQVKEGLYEAQTRYFKSFLIWWSPGGGDWSIPVMPGGYLIGGVLLINLIAAHFQRFQFTKKKLGIWMAHFGIILLLIGQLFTDLLARESQMRLAEGQTLHYSEDFTAFELVFVKDAGAEDEVISVPQSYLANKGNIISPQLPFTIHVKEYHPNSWPVFRAPQMKNAAPKAEHGMAQKLDFEATEITHKTDDKNVPTALIELIPNGGASLGSWVVSGWEGDENMRKYIEFIWGKKVGEQLAHQMALPLIEPQIVEAGGVKYTMSFRPKRYYNPYSVTLLETRHEVYLGTKIPKNYQSRVRIENPQTRENREVDIYMNNPLRYEGLTYFQYQMGQDQINPEIPTSAFQVVRNPSWLTPYAGCALVGGGLLVQFLMHLFGFIKKRKAA